MGGDFLPLFLGHSFRASRGDQESLIGRIRIQKMEYTSEESHKERSFAIYGIYFESKFPPDFLFNVCFDTLRLISLLSLFNFAERFSLEPAK